MSEEKRPSGARPRRRAPAEGPRCRKVVVRFSDAEWAALREQAGLTGAAVGAWLGQLAIAAADPSPGAAADGIGLQDLLRLHADVVLLEQVAASTNARQLGAQLVVLLARVDGVIDAMVAELGRRPV